MAQRFFMVLAAALTLAGCSSESSGDPHFRPSGSGGGAGGATTTTPSSGGHSSSDGGSGEGGSAGPSTVSGTGGAAGTCDDIGTCGDMSNGCIGCAFAGACASQARTCYQDQDCSDYQGCVGYCKKGDDLCIKSCGENHPMGAEEFMRLYECAVCQHCYKSCPDTDMVCTDH